MSDDSILLRDQHPSLRELWEERQTLLSQMHQAQKDAARQAALPFQDRLTELDSEYQMLLMLIGKGDML